MKRFTVILIAVCLLVGCSSSPIQPSATPTSTFTATPTTIPTRTLTPTLTPIPSATPIPELPQTVQIEFDKVIPENIVDLVKNTVDQAYWYYVNMGCSPDFHRVQIVGHESALTIGTDAVLIGWDDLTTISPNMDVRISHEMAHIMCQIAIKKDPDGTGLELMWLLEGTANYFADEERLISTGKLSGIEGTVINHEIGMGEWVTSSNLCGFSFHSVEKDTGTLGKDFPDYPGVGEVAAILLATTSPDGKQALINYYKFLVDNPGDVAFQKAFGRTKDNFYQQFKDECNQGFPTIAKHSQALTLAPRPVPTLAKGYVRVQGNMVLSDVIQNYSDYYIVFCRIDDDNEQCLFGVPINVDGTFITSLIPGKYRMSINPSDGSEAIGWYSKDGLVKDGSCASTIRVYVNQEINITIDLHPISCPT